MTTNLSTEEYYQVYHVKFSILRNVIVGCHITFLPGDINLDFLRPTFKFSRNGGQIIIYLFISLQREIKKNLSCKVYLLPDRRRLVVAVRLTGGIWVTCVGTLLCQRTDGET